MLKNIILVTGGAGYVGTTLVPILLKLNYKVLVIDAFLFGGHLNKNNNFGNYLPKHKLIPSLNEMYQMFKSGKIEDLRNFYSYNY